MTDDLRSRRHRLGLTQKQLGVLLGVSSNTITRWEAGLVKMSRTAILLLERIEADADRTGRPLWALSGGPIAPVVVPIVLQISPEPRDDAIGEPPADPSGENPPEQSPGGDPDVAQA